MERANWLKMPGSPPPLLPFAHWDIYCLLELDMLHWEGGGGGGGGGAKKRLKCVQTDNAKPKHRRT